MSEPSRYRMTLSLNVLEHLGVSLYSNVPAVLAEVVANSWDADAENVKIELEKEDGRITITDDGHGMTLDDINDKYLCVGYKRRDKGAERITPRLKRLVMGRKGIGKLSLFSIADTIEVYSSRDGQRNGFRLSSESIRKAISDQGEQHGTYCPEPIPENEIDIENGTRIVITDLKKNLNKTGSALRKRLARRFSIIGDRHQFRLTLNGSPIGIQDRDYFHNVQYLWYFGIGSEKYVSYAKNQKSSEKLDRLIPQECPVRGWIGTVEKSGDLQDEGENINKITLLVRGKLAQEDILDEFAEGGVYTKYIIGEIESDFLDSDDEQDIATSSRQRIREDDPRYEALSKFVRQVLKHIQSQWTGLRNNEGESEARKIPAIDEWFKSLRADCLRRAKSLFGKINQLPLNEEERRTLFKHAVLAFETLRYRDALSEIGRVSAQDITDFLAAFKTLDEIEAGLYYQIVNERIHVIDTLKRNVEENALEKVLQEHLFKHLWLLDPGWERATETEYIEEAVQKRFEEIDAKLSKDERNGRVDIRYRKTSGIHVIIELKRASVLASAMELVDQVDKYKSALKKCLREKGEKNPSVTTVIVLGKLPKRWEDGQRGEDENALLAKQTTITTYTELIDRAYLAYKDYITRKQSLGRLRAILDGIDASE